MKIEKEYLRLYMVLAFLISISTVFVSQVTAADKYKKGFPESHKHFLGAGSYRAMFGFNANSLTQRFMSPERRFGRLPQIGNNIQVNDPQEFPFGCSETTIATNRSGRFMVLGWNDAEGFCGPPFSDAIPLPCITDTPGFTGYGYSSDGGRTFIDGGTPPMGDRIGYGPGPLDISESGMFITLGDPSMDFAGFGKGTFYFANLAEFVDQVHVAFPVHPTAGIAVHIGKFNWRGSYSWHDAVLLQSPNYPLDFLDKEHIATDKRRHSKNVYVSVTNFIEVDGLPWFGFGQIEAYSSLDGGATWDRSIVQPDETISVDEDIGITNGGSEPAVGPNGTVYVAWERGRFFPLTGGDETPEIRVAISTDNGASWTPTASSGNPAGTLVSKICSGAIFPPAGYNRLYHNDFPRIAVAQRGWHRGRVYVTWQDCRIANGGTQEETGGWGNFDTDIYIAFSDDRGETWSGPVLVAGGGDGKIQFWPTISIQPGGDVDITYYESVETDLYPDPPPPNNPEECVVYGPGGSLFGEIIRRSVVSSLVDLYFTQSTDGGSTFHSPIRMSNVTTNWCNAESSIVPNFGDYNTAVSLRNRIYTTWADGRNGVPDVFFSKIRTAGKLFK